MVKKSNSGKKKQNPYQPQSVKAVAVSSEQKETEKLLKKINRGWIVLALIYFSGMILANQQDSGSMLWFIFSGICYTAMFLWGLLMLMIAKHYQARNKIMMYKLFGAALILLSVFGAVAMF